MKCPWSACEIVSHEIGRVLVNILNNAFYATAEKKNLSAARYSPAVSVSTQDAGDYVEIRIRDNGAGIPVDIREKIFDPFFTTKPAGSGTGLGLSLSYDIVVRAHGGSLLVESEPGEYAEFLIRLPKSPQDLKAGNDEAQNPGC